MEGHSPWWIVSEPSALFGCLGFATEEIRANQAYAGADFLSEDDLLFDSASLELSALDSWIRTTGLSINSATEAQGSQVQYFRPESVSFALDAQTLKIGFWLFVSVSFRSYHFDEKVGVVIENLGGVSSKEIFQQYIYPLQNFFTFATDHPNELDSVVFYNRRSEVSGDRTTVPDPLPGTAHLFGQGTEKDASGTTTCCTPTRT